MLANVFDILFGCAHKNYSFPITTRSHNAQGHTGRSTYVVCLDCGKEFPYDWDQMKIIPATPAQTRPASAPLAVPEPHLNKAA